MQRNNPGVQCSLPGIELLGSYPGARPGVQSRGQLSDGQALSHGAQLVSAWKSNIGPSSCWPPTGGAHRRCSVLSGLTGSQSRGPGTLIPGFQNWFVVDSISPHLWGTSPSWYRYSVTHSTYNLGYGTSFLLTEGFDSVPFWSFSEKLWSGLMLFFILVSLFFAACVLGFRLDPDRCLCLYAKWQFRGPSLLRVPWWNPLQHSTRMLTKCKSDLILISVGQCQGCHLSFLSGLVRSLIIQQGFGIEPQHLHIKGSRLRWFGQTRMPPGHLLGEVFWA